MNEGDKMFDIYAEVPAEFYSRVVIAPNEKEAEKKFLDYVKTRPKYPIKIHINKSQVLR